MLEEILATLIQSYYTLAYSNDPMILILKFFPFVIFLELPMYMVVFAGLLKRSLRQHIERREMPHEVRTYFPSVSCVITCYSEGKEVMRTIRSLMMQIYPGRIQILAIVDGASRNRATYEAALSTVQDARRHKNRKVLVVPKWQRGGRVSALNTGLNFATGEIVMALDGDTSFDNDMVWNATRHFANPAVACVAGCLRVRNVFRSLATRLQAVEYFLSIQLSKAGLSEFNLVNNVSGAFGIFRRSLLDAIKGWDAGTAEDLDLTLRVKSYFGRHKEMRILFDPQAVGHTDVPDTFRSLLQQRIRWDGDLSFIYLRKHRKSFAPSIIGMRNFIHLMINGLLFQLVMPFMIVLYFLFVFFALPLHVALSVVVLTYAFYLFLELFLWLFAILFVSERPLRDLRLTIWVPLMPFYSLALRLVNAFSTIWEMIGRGHEDTAMAPWWTLRKSKF